MKRICPVSLNRQPIGCRLAAFAGIVGLVAVLTCPLEAQELVPAAYTPAPVGINLVTVTSAFNDGDISFDPALPIEDAKARITSTSLTYVRTLSVAGRSANIGISTPYVVGDLEGLVLGQFASAHRSGLGDLAVRGTINLVGAPAMSQQEFRAFRPSRLVGLSFLVIGPAGQYDSTKLVNIGTNRWAFRPEIGFVRVMKRWAFDVYLAGTYFTDNTDYAGGQTRKQDPILGTQAHARYSFSPRMWAALDANFWTGGQTEVEGIPNDDRQQNSRVGLTVVYRFDARQSLRIAASRGAFTRIGGDFDSIGVSYSLTWLDRRRTGSAPQ